MSTSFIYSLLTKFIFYHAGFPQPPINQISYPYPSFHLNHRCLECVLLFFLTLEGFLSLKPSFISSAGFFDSVQEKSLKPLSWPRMNTQSDAVILGKDSPTNKNHAESKIIPPVLHPVPPRPFEHVARSFRIPGYTTNSARFSKQTNHNKIRSS